MKLLFITQKIHENDDDLAFVILWINEFIKAGFDVSVICLEKRDFDNSFPVYSLGKEHGAGKLARVIKFLKLVTTLSYDRVFVHMNPEYFTIGGWWWFLRGIPSYFWYTHYTMTFNLYIAGIIAKRLFAATPQSLPQYEGNPKKVILGHGIDSDYWIGSGFSFDKAVSETSLIYVNRLSRSKRIERAIQALAFLPNEYTLTIYGRVVPGEEDYYDELRELARKKEFHGRVLFNGSVPAKELRTIYPRFRLMVNMASETIDKTMLEGMLFGIYPVTTPGNAQAIGLSVYPEDETPEAIASFIRDGTWKRLSREDLQCIVMERHGLQALVEHMSEYMRLGN